jgi:hypothetical protein
MKRTTSATQRGLVVTSAAEEATEVYSSEATQVAKWRASKTPAPNPQNKSVRGSLRISYRLLRHANGPRSITAKSSRQAAITIDGAPSDWAKRTKIEDVAATKTPAIRIIYGQALDFPTRNSSAAVLCRLSTNEQDTSDYQ